MNKEDYKKLINKTILSKRKNVIFYNEVMGNPLPNGEIKCKEKLVFNDIFELVDFVNNLKIERIVGYHEVEDDDSNLYIYLRESK